MSSVLTTIVESTSGRPGLYNPHSEAPDPRDRRRASWAPLADLPKKPTVSQLVRLGVSMGIHTQNLAANVLDSSDTDVDGESDSDSSSSSGILDGDFNDTANVASNGGLEALEPSRVPLLGAVRRMSHGDLFDRLKKPWKDRRSRKAGGPSAQQSYGAVSQDTGPSRSNGSESRSNNRDDFLSVGMEERPSHTTRPTLSRQNSSILKSSTARKFTSSLVPETRITSDDTGPQIMFAEDQVSPGISRRSTPGVTALLSSKQPARNNIDDNGGGGPRTVSFVEPRYNDGASSSPDKSRANSPPRTGTGSGGSGDGGGDVLLNIPELLSSYKFQQQQDNDDAAEAGSSYSTQGLPLSFNDLPSRAQHLILNELMRQNSADTAVLFTTLPVPEENTCRSEEASLTYLSDVEVLCNGLPPMLLVLSNNMTVTVSL